MRLRYLVTRRPARILRRVIAAVAIAALFTALTVWWVWPWPKDLATHMVAAPYWWDSELNTSILWQAQHNVASFLSAPGGLLDAHVYHPHRDVLAYSENLLTLAVVAQLFPRDASPYLVHNAIFLAALVLGAITTYLYLRRRPLSRLAAIAGTIVFSFAPWRLCLLGRVQLVATMLIPVVLLSFEAALDRPSFRRWFLTGLAWLLQLGVCMYYGVYLVVLLGPVAAVLVFARPRTRRPRALAGLSVAVALTTLLGALLFSSYLHVAKDMGFERDPGWIAATSGTFNDLHTSSTLLVEWPKLAREVNAYSAREPIAFPGAVGLGFGLLGLVAWLVARRGHLPGRSASGLARSFRRPMLALRPHRGRFGVPLHFFWLALCLLLFLGTGPHAPGGADASLYSVLYSHVPGFSGLRYPSRFIVPGTFFLGVLAAYGAEAVARAFRRIGRGPAAAVAGLGCAALAMWELRTIPLPLVQLPQPTPVYGALVGDTGAHALLELPFEPLNPHEPRIDRALAATEHGLPVVNGYTGYDPPFLSIAPELFSTFPDDRSYAAIRALGVDRVIVRDFARASTKAALDAHRAPWLRVIYDEPPRMLLAVSGVSPTRAATLRREVWDFRLGPRAPERAVPRGALRLRSPMSQRGVGRLLDGDPTTHWIAGRVASDSQVWVEVTFDHARRVTALWLDAGGKPAGLPRAVRVRARDASGKWRTVLDQPMHLPVGALFAAPGRAPDILRFSPVTATALELSSTAAARGQTADLSELSVEEAP